MARQGLPMPTESKLAAPEFDLNDADGGRGYIAHLFKTVLRRHDYRQYITERLAGDFACTLAQHFEDIKARETDLQQRLTAADEANDKLSTAYVAAGEREHELRLRVDVLEGLLRDINDAPGGSQFKKHIDTALNPAPGEPDRIN